MSETDPNPSMYWRYLGSWEEWGPLLLGAGRFGIPVCAARAIEHLYGQHLDEPHGYCPQCHDAELAAAMSETDPNLETVTKMREAGATNAAVHARVADSMVAAAVAAAEERERERYAAIVAAVNAERRQRPISYAAAAGWQSACAEIGERLREVPSTERTDDE